MGTFVINQPNVIIDLNGSAVSTIPATGSSTTFSVHAPNFEIKNGRIMRAFVFVHSYAAGLHMHDMSFDNITYGVPAGSPVGTKATQNNGVAQVYTSDNNGAIHNTLENLKVGYTGTVGIYFSSDYIIIRNSTMAGSYGEYNIRSEVTSETNPHKPVGTLIDNIQCDNTINAYGKSCIGIRMSGPNAVIQNCSIKGSNRTGYINLGQGGGATGVGTNVEGILLKNNTFYSPRSPQLEIDQGVNAVVDSNIFITPASFVNIAIATKNNVKLVNNIRKLSIIGIPLNKFWSTVFTGPAAPIVSETGTTIVNP